METQTHNPPGVDPVNETPAPGPNLASLAQQLASKHGSPGASPTQAPGRSQPVPQRNKGGRRPIEEEVSAYLERNGLRTVQMDAQGDPGGDSPGGPKYVVTPDFVKTASETLLKGIESWRVRQVFQTAVELSGDRDLSKELAAEAQAPVGTIDVIAVCAAEISQKYDVLSEWSPEVILLVAGAVWFAKDAALVRRLDELRELKRKSANAN